MRYRIFWSDKSSLTIVADALEISEKVATFTVERNGFTMGALVVPHEKYDYIWNMDYMTEPVPEGR